MSKILALLLAFFLGFLSCIGTIVGVGYYAYSTITYDRLKGWNLVPDESRYFEEDPEKDLTEMSLKSFFAELQELSQLGDEFTLDLMIDRWGLKIPDDIQKLIPDGIRTVAMKDLFSSRGFDLILEKTPVSYLFAFLEINQDDKDDDNPGTSEKRQQFELAREALKGKTLKDVVSEDRADVLVGLKLGYVLGMEYEKDENGQYKKTAQGNYVVKFKDPDKPELIELLGGLDLGLTLKMFNGDSDLFTIIENGLSEVMVERLIYSMTQKNDDAVSNLFAGKTIGDLLVKDEETGEYSFSIRDVLNGRKVGDLLGYTPVYLNGDAESGIVIDWVDDDGVRLTGPFRGIADGTLDGLGGDEIDTDALTESLLSNAYIGFFQEYEPVYDAEGNIVDWLDQDGSELDRMSRKLAEKKVSDLIADDDSDDSLTDKLLDGLFVGDLMGYTPVYASLDSEEVVGWKDGNGADLDKVSEALAKKTVSEVTSGTFVMNNVLEGLYVGDLLKYTPVKDDPTDPEKITGWRDGNGEALDRLTDALAKKHVTDLTGGEFEIGDVLDGLYVGDMMKYTPIKNDPVDPEKITGWLDRQGKEVSGIDRATANIDLKRLVDDDTYKVTDAFNDVYMGEAMNYYRDADPLPKENPADPDEKVRYQWYKTKDPVTGTLSDPTAGIEQKLSNYFLKDLMDGKVTTDNLTKGVPLHELLNLHAVETLLYDKDGNALNYTTGEHAGTQGSVKIWYDKNNVRQSDTISALADCTIDGISDQVNNVKVGGITGLTEFEGVWYKAEFKTEDFDGDSIPETRYCLDASSGVLASLADLTVGQLSDNDVVTEKVKTVKIGDAMGYTLYEGKWYTDAGHAAPVTGMMKALSPKTVGQMDTIATTMPVGELLGYEKVGGVWYRTYSDDGDDSNDVLVEGGTMLAISDFTIEGENGLENKIGTVYIGDVIGYKKVEDVWYTSYTDAVNNTPVAGIMKPFAGLTIDQMKVSSNVTNAVQDVYIGDAMGYTLYEGKWYTDAEHTHLVTGMMKALAPKKVSEMDDVSSTVHVGELLGYEKHDGIWYSAYDPLHPENGQVTGVVGAISDSYVDTLSDDVNQMELGKVLSLYKYENANDPTDPKNGKWFKDRTYSQEATGVMVTFADMKIEDLSDETKVTEKSVNVVIGYAMGYTYVGGVWYTDSEHLHPVTGVMKALAPKKVGELNDITHTMTVGEMMGYEKSGGVWYTDSTLATPATGVIQAVADSTIDNLESDLNNTKVGKILGYTYNEGEHWWYNGVSKTSTIINTVSDTKLDQLGTRMSNLTVADMFSETERQSGFLSLLPYYARLDELGGSGPNSMSEIFKNTTMGDYVTKGLISFNSSTQEKLTHIDPDWQTRTIQQFIDHLIDSVPMVP